MLFAYYILLLQLTAGQQRNQKETAVRLIENEAYIFPYNTKAIFRKPNLIDENPLSYQIEVSKIVKTEKNVSNANPLVFSFPNNNFDYTYIYIVEDNKISSKLLVKNVLIDDEVIIEERVSEKSINTNLTNCKNLFQITNEILLLHCQINIGEQIFLILDMNNQAILDELRFQTSDNCSVDSSFQSNFLWIFETQCREFQITKVIFNVNKLIFERVISNIRLEIAELSKLGDPNKISVNPGLYFTLIFQQAIVECYQSTLECVTRYETIENEFTENLLLCYSQDLFLISQQSNQANQAYQFSQNTLKFNKQLLNTYKESYSIYNHVAIQLDTCIYIIANQLQYQIINQKARQINVLVQCPVFIILTTDGDLLFYQISQKQFLFQINQHQEQQFQIYFMSNFNLILDKTEIIKIKYYDLNEPQIIIQNFSTPLLYISNTSVSFDFSYAIEGLPIEVLNWIDSGDILNDIITSQVMNCGFNDIPENFEIRQHFQEVLLNCYKQQLDQIVVMKNLQHEQYIIQIIPGYNSIYYSYYYDRFMLVYERSIICYSISTELNMIQLNFSSPILQVQESYNSLYLFFQDCTILKYDFLRLSINYNYTHPYNCTGIKWVVPNKIHIEEYLITLLFLNQISREYKFQKQIIKAEVMTEKRLLIYQFAEQTSQIKITLYYFDFSQLTVLYQLPQYEYNYKYPVKTKSYLNYLAILAENLEYDVILIYNVNNEAATSLISVIKIDKGNQNFAFQNAKPTIYYVFSGKIRSQEINTISLQLKQNLMQDTFIILANLTLNVTSPVNHQIQLVPIELRLINYDQQLRRRNNNSKEILNKSKLNFDGIYGNVQKLSIESEGETKLYFPLQYTNLSVKCLYYSETICVNQNNSIVINIFGDQKLFESNIPLSSKIFDIEYFQTISGYNALYHTETDCQDETSIKFSINKLESERNITYQLLQNLDEAGSLKRFHGILVQEFYDETNLFCLSDNILILLPSSLHLMKKIYDKAYLWNNTYLFVFEHKTNLSLAIQIIQIDCSQNNDITVSIILQNKIQYEELIFTNFVKDQHNTIKKLRFISFSLQHGQLETEIAIFCSYYFAYIYNGSFLVNSSQTNQSITNVLRYGYKSFSSLIYLDNKFILLQLMNDLSVVLYDISGRRSKYIIDYIYYEIEVQEHIFEFEFERYNSTHHVKMTKFEEYQKVELVTLNEYFIEYNQSSTEQLLFHLQNSVSNLTITIDLNVMITNKIQPLKSKLFVILVLILDFIFLLTILQLKSKKYNEIKKGNE